MANITYDKFVLLFDEFKSANKDKITAWIDVASSRVSPVAWGSAAEYATGLLVAHMLTMSGVGGGGAGGGALTNEAVGDLSRGFGTVGVPGSGDQELLTTRYGQDYVALRRENIVAANVTGPPIGLPPFSGC